MFDSTTSTILTDRISTDPVARMALTDLRIEQGSDPEEAAREVANLAASLHAKFLATCLARSGVTGIGDSLKALAGKITRRRPRGSGSKMDLAKRLQDACQKRADRAWALACKGQRKPTAAQAAQMRVELESTLSVQSRSRERLLDLADLVRVGASAIADGSAGTNGGTISCGSYGYQWSTTTAQAARTAAGTIQLRVSRSGTRTVEFPAAWFRSLAAEMAG